ncbi:hypothetical protein DNHGIG_25360 [Collibacillus ludicampi]|uniref:DUF5082 domain-containing protein n=1 Tax=Collibacillus ludicampi TaxID=2771369 RepID=A0AAV4LGR9_9BACL|nr:hypothetical protein [Collibacillus ludicampi]GIM46987.1 hypothetical protein DNHGIG_25360 [Collibacillus ludicampi]
MVDPWNFELIAIKKRLYDIEEQVHKKSTPVRVDKVEYRIENLIVEKLDNGTLDLGVHLGNEVGRGIGKGDDSKGNEWMLPAQPADLIEELQHVKKRVELLEIKMRNIEMRVEHLTRSVEYLEGLHS